MAQETFEKNVTTFRRYLAQKSWQIIAEKNVAHGLQLEVSDGHSTIPITFFFTGKILVQGKANTFQMALQSWKEQQQGNQTSPTAKTSITRNKDASVRTGEALSNAESARIGSDESGKGDYFGPLIVTAIYVDKQSVADLVALGVRDSKLLKDKAILALAKEIRIICRGQGSIQAITPQRYNALYRETPNLNQLLANLHAQALTSVQNMVQCEYAIVDQFGDKSLVPNALMKQGTTMTVEQRYRAEEDTAVAAASIVARATFVQQLEQLSEELGISLPKGASDPAIITVGRELVTRHGTDILTKVAKRHFSITEKILAQS